MSAEQYTLLDQFFLQIDEPFTAYHGGCVGADEQFHKMVLSYQNCEQIYIYPSDILDKQGECQTRPWDVRNHPYPPLSRNRLIVAMCDVLLATPKENQMRTRSGTWTTVRYAHKAGKQLRIFLPNGGWTTTP
jgi:predicted Rossmann fold nucleotide-binding protein DprA/Smf involved in DNA uptake